MIKNKNQCGDPPAFTDNILTFTKKMPRIN